MCSILPLRRQNTAQNFLLLNTKLRMKNRCLLALTLLLLSVWGSNGLQAQIDKGAPPPASAPAPALDSLISKGIMAAPMDASEGMLGISDKQLIDMLLFAVDGIGSLRIDLTQQDLKPHFMPIRTVGRYGNELSYALASCLEYYINLKKNPRDDVSPDFITQRIAANGLRLTLEAGLRFLAYEGSVSARVMGFDSPTLPPTAQTSERYKITNYLAIAGDSEDGRQKIAEIKRAITRGHPVVAEINADAGFRNQQGVSIWNPDSSQPVQRYTITIVAFNEAQQQFEIRMPWGVTWGNNGYIAVRYSDLERVVGKAYSMLPGM